MTIKELYEYLNYNWSNLPRMFGFSQNAYQYWLKKGYIPMSSQRKIEELTEGKLTAYREPALKNENIY